MPAFVGPEFLNRIKMAAATAAAMTCHIGHGDHKLPHGVISHVNRTAARLGGVCACADLMRSTASLHRKSTRNHRCRATSCATTGEWGSSTPTRAA